MLSYRITSNNDSTKLVRVDLILLVVFIQIHPDALANQIAAFIFNEGGNIYLNSEITK